MTIIKITFFCLCVLDRFNLVFDVNTYIKFYNVFCAINLVAFHFKRKIVERPFVKMLTTNIFAQLLILCIGIDNVNVMYLQGLISFKEQIYSLLNLKFLRHMTIKHFQRNERNTASPLRHHTYQLLFIFPTLISFLGLKFLLVSSHSEI